MRVAIVGLVVLLLTGCTSAVTLRHPRTGQTAKCGPYYSLGFYYFMATERERTCVNDFQRQGYERVPDDATSAPSSSVKAWELIYPPSADADMAPIQQWAHVQSFSSAEACEDYNRQQKVMQLEALAKITEEASRSTVAQHVAVVTMGRCVPFRPQ